MLTRRTNASWLKAKMSSITCHSSGKLVKRQERRKWHALRGTHTTKISSQSHSAPITSRNKELGQFCAILSKTINFQSNNSSLSLAWCVSTLTSKTPHSCALVATMALSWFRTYETKCPNRSKSPLYVPTSIPILFGRLSGANTTQTSRTSRVSLVTEKSVTGL